MDRIQIVIRNLMGRFGSPHPSLPKMDLGVRQEGQNPLMIQFFEWDSQGTEDCTWWQRFELEVPELAELGVTQAWLPPPNKGVENDSRGYDAYDLWDLGEFFQKEGKATRWGTKDQLLKASATAKEHGIGVIVDAVLNHKLGADRTETFAAVEVDPQNRNVEIGPVREIDGWTAFDFPGRGEKVSLFEKCDEERKFKWRKEHFTGVDLDQSSGSRGIFRLANKEWSTRVDTELGNYDFLLGVDIDHRHPGVQQDFLSWGPWVLNTIGASGFRLDAIKHMDRRFLLQFIKSVRSQGHPNLFSVAEYWSADYEKLKPYIRALRGEVAFFDVPLHYNFHYASLAGPTCDLRQILNNTVVQNRPGDAVTFVDNHDTQIGQTLESWVNKSFKLQAYAIILLRANGYPCVFYGDLFPCSFHDPDIARDLRRLICCRRDFAYGEEIDYIARSPHSNCVGFTRTGTGAYKGCVVLISNADGRLDSEIPEHVLLMCAGKRNTHQCYRNVFEDLGEVTTDEGGVGSFRCPPGRVAVWIHSSDLNKVA